MLTWYYRKITSARPGKESRKDITTSGARGFGSTLYAEANTRTIAPQGAAATIKPGFKSSRLNSKTP